MIIKKHSNYICMMYGPSYHQEYKLVEVLCDNFLNPWMVLENTITKEKVMADRSMLNAWFKLKKSTTMETE